MLMTSAMAQAWVTYLLHHMTYCLTLEELEAAHQHFSSELDCLVGSDLIDYCEEDTAYTSLHRAYNKQRSLIIQAIMCESPALLQEPWRTRVQDFSDQFDPRNCTCDHKQQGTGVFYQSMGVLQCATCNNWQVIRKPIK